MCSKHCNMSRFEIIMFIFRSLDITVLKQKLWVYNSESPQHSEEMRFYLLTFDDTHVFYWILNFLKGFNSYKWGNVQTSSFNRPSGWDDRSFLSKRKNMYMIHCTWVITELVLIIHGQIIKNVRFVGFEPRIKILHGNAFWIPSKIMFARK